MSLLPDKHNFKAWAGATFRVRITLFADEGDTLRDLAGYSAELVIRDKPQGTPFHTLSTTNGGIILEDEGQGTVDLFISDSDTASFTWKTGVYDLTITNDTSGDTDALLYGGFSVLGI